MKPYIAVENASIIANWFDTYSEWVFIVIKLKYVDNIANFTPFFTIKFALTDFTTNKICSRIKSYVCKSVCIHSRNAVKLNCYE